MKTRCQIPLLLIIIILLAACDDAVQPPHSSGTMSSTIQNQAWNASDVFATYALIQGRHELSISGRFVSEGVERNRVDIAIADAPGPGTYVIANTNAVLVFINSMHVHWNDADYHVPFTMRQNLVAGSVSITAIDGNRVRGTFQVTLYRNADSETSDTISVTNGQFDVTIAR